MTAVPSVGKKRTNFLVYKKPDPSVDVKLCDKSFKNGYKDVEGSFYLPEEGVENFPSIGQFDKSAKKAFSLYFLHC